MRYKEITINKNANDNTYNCVASDDFWADADDMLNDIREFGDVFELGIDDLPDEPERVFAMIDENDRVSYFGIDSDGGTT